MGSVETTYLVEQYWPGLTAEVFSSATRRIRAAATEMTRAGAPIRHLHSTMVPADETAFCVVAAASADLVGQLYSRANVRFERIVVALEA